jgi:CDP-glucose 4,6-dehydratase
MQKFRQTFGGERVLVTGHTGFKGAWLSFWLSGIGAQVSGYSLDPEPSQRELFEIVREGGAFAPGRDVRGNIGDYDRVRECVRETRPDFVFHLAAQSLVRRSYVRPVETFASNVLGTVHLLEAVRAESPDATVVVVTTDKCYENREWAYSYRETDALGGRDPYSASKAAAEIATAAWRASFFDGAEVSGRIATARAGNVIGGGDYADDRIVPDLVRALAAGQALGVPIRLPCPGTMARNRSVRVRALREGLQLWSDAGIGTHRRRSGRGMFEALARPLGRSLRAWRTPRSDPARGLDRAVARRSRVAAELGFPHGRG